MRPWYEKGFLGKALDAARPSASGSPKDEWQILKVRQKRISIQG
jgi:hypothetical protein